MADLGQFIESSAALTIQEILAPFRYGEGIAKPSQYEVLFFPPTGYSGSGGKGKSDNFMVDILQDSLVLLFLLLVCEVIVLIVWYLFIISIVAHHLLRHF